MSHHGVLAMITDILPFVILLLHFTDKWYLSKGRLLNVYILTIAGSACTVAYNCMLWAIINDVSMERHNSILIFSVNSAWTIAMAIKGIVWLVKDRKIKRSLNKFMSS
jgi:hypothetical protein